MRHRLLTRSPFSRSWSWTRLSHGRCGVVGWLCDYDERTGSKRVFNLHTRVFHELPPPQVAPAPDAVGAFDMAQPVIGMTVGASGGFRIFLGDGGIGTRIYDSETNSWTQKPSVHDLWVLAQGNRANRKVICVSSNGVLYIRAWRTT